MESDLLRIKQLTEAVEHRTTIGIAIGMLMERFEFEHEAAFDYLRRCSQGQNRKLYDICVDFVADRVLPVPGAVSQSA
jgi:AmiR/NasT family two-component response regulator